MSRYDDAVSAMRAGLPARPELRDYVRFGTLASNSHNTQPWKFRLGADTIDILPDLSRRTPIVDPDDHHLYVTLGCAAQNIVIAANASSRPAEVSLTTDGGEGTAIHVDLGRGSGMGHATDADLCSAIPVRQSPMVEVARYAVNGVVAVRLAWSSRVEIDNLPLQFFERPSFSISTISPASIQHSVHGNVAAALQRSGDQPVLLNPGERIDLEYSLSAVPSGVRRVLICAIRGRYERDNAGRQAVTVPSSFSFEQNYPNPFNPSTTFRFGLPTAQLVRLELYNILGQRVGTLANSAYEAGYHQIDWDGQLGGQPVASGVYLARLVAGPFHATRKMMVVK